MEYRALSNRYAGITFEPLLEIGVSAPYVIEPGAGMPLMERVMALWDTGATGSMITARAARMLGLGPYANVLVLGVTGAKVVPSYLLNIHLPNALSFPDIAVTESETLGDGIDILLGMDIISHGDFAISNFGGETLVTFRVPSMSQLDFTKVPHV